VFGHLVSGGRVVLYGIEDREAVYPTVDSENDRTGTSRNGCGEVLKQHVWTAQNANYNVIGLGAALYLPGLS